MFDTDFVCPLDSSSLVIKAKQKCENSYLVAALMTSMNYLLLLLFILLFVVCLISSIIVLVIHYPMFSFISGLIHLLHDLSFVCHMCPLGKSHHLYFTIHTYIIQGSLELLHLNVWGPTFVLLFSSFKYYLSIINDFSRYTWLYLMFNKSDVIIVFFFKLKLMIKKFLSYSIWIVRYDGGGEFDNKLFHSFLSHTILHINYLVFILLLKIVLLRENTMIW